MTGIEKRDALDAAIIKHIKSGNVCHPTKAYDVVAAARKFKPGSNRKVVIDGRLKRLRIHGRIVATRWRGCGWAISEPVGLEGDK